VLSRYVPVLTHHTSTHHTEANFQEKIPEIEKSLAIVRTLKEKKDNDETLVTRYSLADAVYGKAQVDTSDGNCQFVVGS
jgi:hypothetical protein